MAQWITDLLPQEGAEVLFHLNEDIERDSLSENIKSIENLISKLTTSRDISDNPLPFNFPANFPMNPVAFRRVMKLMERQLKATHTRSLTLNDSLNSLQTLLSTLTTKNALRHYNILLDQYKSVLSTKLQNLYPGASINSFPVSSVTSGDAHVTLSGELTLQPKNPEIFSFQDATVTSLKGWSKHPLLFPPKGFMFLAYTDDLDKESFSPQFSISLDYEHLINYLRADVFFPAPDVVKYIIIRDSTGRVTKKIDNISSNQGLEYHFPPVRAKSIDFLCTKVEPMLSQWDSTTLTELNSFLDSLTNIANHGQLELDLNALRDRTEELRIKESVNSKLQKMVIIGSPSIECGLTKYKSSSHGIFRLPTNNVPKYLVYKSTEVNISEDLEEISAVTTTDIAKSLITNIGASISLDFQATTNSSHLFAELPLPNVADSLFSSNGWFRELLFNPTQSLDGKWSFLLSMPIELSTYDTSNLMISPLGSSVLQNYSVEQINEYMRVIVAPLLNSEYMAIYKPKTSTKGESLLSSQFPYYYSSNGGMILDNRLGGKLNAISFAIKLQRGSLSEYITPRIKDIILLTK